MNLIGCLDTPCRGSYLLNGKQVSEMNDNELARIRNEEIGFVFQTFNLLPRATALHNVELPLVYAGIAARDRSGARQERAGEGRARRADDAPAERTVRRPAPACRDCAGARQQSVDSARRRADGQPRFEDRPGDHAVFERLHKAGNTIVLVTHEADIAAFAYRTIRDPRRADRKTTSGELLNNLIASISVNCLTLNSQLNQLSTLNFQQLFNSRIAV